MGVRYTICHWAINRTDPQNSLSTILDVPLQSRYGRVPSPGVTLKGAKGTISLAQAKDAVPGPNCMLKSLWE